MLNTAVTNQALQDLVDIVCVKPDGTPWTAQGVQNLRRSMCRMLADTIGRHTVPLYGQFLTPETITAYCDGTTARPRDVGDRVIAADDHCQTVGNGSIPNLAKLSIKILQHIDPAADVSALEVLIAQAEAAGKERARVRNATTPSFAVFHDAAAKHGPEVLECTCKDLNTLSALTYLLLQVVVAPTRERMLLYARACSTDDFDPDVDHSAAVLDTMKAEHPTHASTIALATVLFADGEPTELVLGVHGCTDARKNNFYHRICLKTPILPETAHLLPLVHCGLRQLHADYTDGNFLLRSALKPLGDTPFGRNWCTDSVFKPMVGHPVGVLRKSVEQRALAVHVANPGTFTLDDCVEVHRRCQHKPATAMASYVAGKLAELGGSPAAAAAAEVVATTTAAVVATTAAAATAVIAASDSRAAAAPTGTHWPSVDCGDAANIDPDTGYTVDHLDAGSDSEPDTDDGLPVSWSMSQDTVVADVVADLVNAVVEEAEPAPTPTPTTPAPGHTWWPCWLACSLRRARRTGGTSGSTSGVVPTNRPCRGWPVARHSQGRSWPVGSA